MADLTFFKDAAIILLLALTMLIHTAAAACGFFIKIPNLAKILNTGLTSLNIFIHIFLIGFMMYKGIVLDEAVLVMMISVFFHTLLYFIYYSIADYKRKKQSAEEVTDGDI